MITISILVHNDFTHIYRALQSIITETNSPYEIIVVINSGSHEKIKNLKNTFPDLTYIVNKTPKGFAANHNMVMDMVNTPYIALLNDDILIKDHALDKQIEYLAKHDNIGMIGAQLEYEDGSLQVTAYSDPSLLRMIYKISGFAKFTNQRSLLRKWLIAIGIGKVINVSSLSMNTQIRDVQVLKAASIIVRKVAVDDVGYIDEATQGYGEEIDWDWRMRQAGWRIVLLPQARIVHYGLGQATLNLQGWQIIEDRKGILNYFIKHRPLWQVLILRFTIGILHLIQAILAIFITHRNVRPHLQTAIMGLTWRRLPPM